MFLVYVFALLGKLPKHEDPYDELKSHVHRYFHSRLKTAVKKMQRDHATLNLAAPNVIVDMHNFISAIPLDQRGGPDSALSQMFEKLLPQHAPAYQKSGHLMGYIDFWANIACEFEVRHFKACAGQIMGAIGLMYPLAVMGKPSNYGEEIVLDEVPYVESVHRILGPEGALFGPACKAGLISGLQTVIGQESSRQSAQQIKTIITQSTGGISFPPSMSQGSSPLDP